MCTSHVTMLLGRRWDELTLRFVTLRHRSDVAMAWLSDLLTAFQLNLRERHCHHDIPEPRLGIRDLKNTPSHEAFKLCKSVLQSFLHDYDKLKWSLSCRE